MPNPSLGRRTATMVGSVLSCAMLVLPLLLAAPASSRDVPWDVLKGPKDSWAFVNDGTTPRIALDANGVLLFNFAVRSLPFSQKTTKNVRIVFSYTVEVPGSISDVTGKTCLPFVQYNSGKVDCGHDYSRVVNYPMTTFTGGKLVSATIPVGLPEGLRACTVSVRCHGAATVSFDNIGAKERRSLSARWKIPDPQTPPPLTVVLRTRKI